MKRPLRAVLRIFVTGALAALPLVATVAIFWWAVSLLLRWVGPNSRIGGLLKSIGLGVTGSEIVGYLIGIAIVAALLFGLGLLVESRLQRGLAVALNSLVQRIPVVRNVYDLMKKFTDLLKDRDEEGLRSMSPVWCHFGGPGGAAALGLLSTPTPVDMNGQPYLAVLVPTAPVPVGGGLLYVPQSWVTPADIGVEALTSIYVSMGVTSPQHLPVSSAPRKLGQV
jgi:uncharacterized membrane protein